MKELQIALAYFAGNDTYAGTAPKWEYHLFHNIFAMEPPLFALFDFFFEDSYGPFLFFSIDIDP